LRRLVSLLVLSSLVAILAGCGGGTSPRTGRSSKSGGCESAGIDGGTTTIPVAVGNFDEGKAVFADLCIGGKGRGRMQLRDAAGEGARLVGRGIPLQGQVFGAVDDAPIYRAGGAVGTIGSDILARFGAVRIDYRAGTMAVEGREGKPLDGLAEATSGPLPSGLVRGTPKIVAPMSVQALPGSVTMRVEVRLGGGGPLAFIPDTGAPRAAYVDPTEAEALGLRPSGKAYEENSFCARRRVPGVEGGSWSISARPLRPRPLAVTPLIGSVHADGLIGGLTFDEYGSVVFDYTGGRLVLGAG
jgi:Aspartyl protease